MSTLLFVPAMFDYKVFQFASTCKIMRHLLFILNLFCHDPDLQVPSGELESYPCTQKRWYIIFKWQFYCDFQCTFKYLAVSNSTLKCISQEKAHSWSGKHDPTHLHTLVSFTITRESIQCTHRSSINTQEVLTKYKLLHTRNHKHACCDTSCGLQWSCQDWMLACEHTINHKLGKVLTFNARVDALYSIWKGSATSQRHVPNSHCVGG